MKPQCYIKDKSGMYSVCPTFNRQKQFLWRTPRSAVIAGRRFPKALLSRIASITVLIQTFVFLLYLHARIIDASCQAHPIHSQCFPVNKSLAVPHPSMQEPTRNLVVSTPLESRLPYVHLIHSSEVLPSFTQFTRFQPAATRSAHLNYLPFLNLTSGLIPD